MRPWLVFVASLLVAFGVLAGSPWQGDGAGGGGSDGTKVNINNATETILQIAGAQMLRLVAGTAYFGATNTTYIDGVNSSALTSFVGRGQRTDLLSGTNSGNTTAVSRLGDSTGYVEIYGGGMVRETPIASVISAPTDTTTTPVTSTACRISSSGTAAWTPSKSGAVDGMHALCTNTGANVITVTTLSGTCECGAGIALGQWDTVELAYISDRWTCTATRDN